jgi:prepilin-type N-terminal cleavage/methylation domain-containing protein
MRSRERSGAFTLLEVLAAVALLGVLYTTLASVAIQGVRSEGASRRELDASLLADRTLVSIEAELDAGEPPTLGVTEMEEEPYRVRVEAAAFDLEAALAAAAPPEGASAVVLPPPAPTAPEGEAPPLIQIDVVVSWDEDGEERSIERTTFAFDPAAIEAAAPPASSEGAAPPAPSGSGAPQPPARGVTP